MASIRKEILIDAAPADVWDALRDVSALHVRLVPGFVVDTRMDGDARIVTFGNGMVARELIVTIDNAERRLVWAATGGALTHHNASAQVFADGDGTRLVWIADLKPDAAAPMVRAMIDQGASAMQRTLSRGASAA